MDERQAGSDGDGTGDGARGGRRALPLTGVRVLDLSQLLPGPIATQILADLGAEVIKVERPGGDPVRAMMPGFFEAVSRGKRSVVLDLKTPGARAAVLRLAARSDVVVEGFRPGVARRLGVDHETLRAVRPSLLYCSVSGYGQTGPRRREPGHDLNFLGLAGALTSPLEGAAWSLGTALPIADTLGGAYAACAILAGLRDGAPRRLDVGISEAVLAGMAPALSEHVARGRPGSLPAQPAYSVFRTRDGARLSVACTEDHFWTRLCTALGLDALLADAELATWEGRTRHAGRIDAALAAVIATRPRQAWIDVLGAEGLPVAPVHDFDAALAEPQFTARDAFHRGCDGHVEVGFPALLDGRRPPPLARPAALGEHTAEVLREVGLTEADLALPAAAPAEPA